MRLSRAGAAFGHDVVMAAVAFLLSFYLRVGDDIAAYVHERALQSLRSPPIALGDKDRL